jgi:hypothetical protein
VVDRPATDVPSAEPDAGSDTPASLGMDGPPAGGGGAGGGGGIGGGAGGAGGSDATDAPEETANDAGNVCVPEERDAAACTALAQELVWVLSAVPNETGASTEASGPISTDLLGNVTPIGAFTRLATGELSLTTGGASKTVTTPSPFAGDVRATSVQDIWVVPRAITAGGSSLYFVGNLLTSQFAHWDGGSWTVVSAPPAISGALTALWVRTPELWVAAAPPAATSGMQPVIYRWRDGTWSAVPSPLDTSPTAWIAAMWGASAGDIWAGGKVATGPGATDPIRAFIMRWDGTTWSQVTPPVLTKDWQSVVSIWGTSSQDVWFGGVDSSPVALDAGNAAGYGNIWHFDGTNWVDERLQISISASAFFGLWGTGPTDLWASSNYGLRHYDGTAWRVGPPPNYPPGVSSKEAVLDQVKGTTADGLWGVVSLHDFSPCRAAYSTPVPTLFHQQLNVCGDGALGACEECDPPARPQSGKQCGCDCHYLRCGNGIVDPGEDCDPPGGTCDATCHLPTCGNKKLDPGEECDPPNGTTCDSQCRNIPIVCGNGIVQPGEECDAPDGITCQKCKVTCCGQCFGVAYGLAGSGCQPPEICGSLTGQDRSNCFLLLNCLLLCPSRSLIPYSNAACFCSQAAATASGQPTSCSVYGACAAQYQAVAKTTDDAEIVRQVRDRSTTAGAVTAEAPLIGGYGCQSFCATDTPPTPPPLMPPCPTTF